MYFIINSNEDGEVFLEALEREELLKRITPDEDGCTDYGGAEIWTGSLAPGKSLDLQAREGLFIIKGELVAPRVKEVVKVMEID